MSQGPLCPNLSQKVQKEVSQMANHNLPHTMLSGGLSVNSYKNTIKKTTRGITQMHLVKQKTKINQEKEDDYHWMLKVA